jgi:hypothetical protein
LFIILIQTYWEVPHLGVKIGVTTWTFHSGTFGKSDI